MVERIRNNIVFIFYVKYEIKEHEVAEKLIFLDYMNKFDKSYAGAEFEMRYQNFKVSESLFVLFLFNLIAQINIMNIYYLTILERSI